MIGSAWEARVSSWADPDHEIHTSRPFPQSNPQFTSLVCSLGGIRQGDLTDAGQVEPYRKPSVRIEV